MKFLLFKTAFFIISIPMMIGCGGESSSDSSNNGGATNGSSSNGGTSINWSPKTTNVTCDLSSIGGGTYSALGDITVSCQKDNRQSVKYGFQNVKSLTAIQIIKHKYLTIENGSDKLHTIYDYEKGTIAYSGTIDGTSYDCVETYPSIVPDTLVNSNIGKILSWTGNSNDRVNTTCSETFYTRNINSNYNDKNQIKGLVFFGINYTITDDMNQEHLISEYRGKL